MAEKLLPCPLCGGDWGWNISNDAPWHMPYVRCLGVDCNCAVYGRDQQQVIDRVNRRAPGPATAAMVIQAELAVNDIEQHGRAGVSVLVDPTVARAFIAEHEPAKEGGRG